MTFSIQNSLLIKKKPKFKQIAARCRHTRNENVFHRVLSSHRISLIHWPFRVIATWRKKRENYMWKCLKIWISNLNLESTYTWIFTIKHIQNIVFGYQRRKKRPPAFVLGSLLGILLSLYLVPFPTLLSIKTRIKFRGTHWLDCSIRANILFLVWKMCCYNSNPNTNPVMHSTRLKKACYMLHIRSVSEFSGVW